MGKEGLQEIVIKVNGTPITKKKLYDEMGALAYREYKTVLQLLPPEKVKALREIAAEKLITDELLKQEGKRMGLIVYKEELEKEFEDAKGDFPFPELYRDFLKSENLTEEDYKRLLEDDLLVKKTKEKLLEDYEIPEEELRSYYEENKDAMVIPERVRASHILIKVKEDDPEEVKKEARKKIEDLREMALSGDDFGKLARGFSQCPSSYDDGDLGYLVRGQTEENFDRALFSLKEGEISEVVETSFGYHIIYLKERLKPEKLSFEDAKEGMIKKIKEKKEALLLSDIIERLMQSADIEMLNGAGTGLKQV